MKYDAAFSAFLDRQRAWDDEICMIISVICSTFFSLLYPFDSEPVEHLHRILYYYYLFPICTGPDKNGVEGTS